MGQVRELVETAQITNTNGPKFAIGEKRILPNKYMSKCQWMNTSLFAH